MLSFVEWAELDEVLTAQQRKKRGIQMKRNRAKLRRGRKRARQRVAGGPRAKMAVINSFR